MQDIHDLKPLLSVDFPWFSFLAALMLFIGLILLVAWGIRRLLRRPKKAPPAEKPVPKPNLREQTLRALKALKPDPAHPGQFYLQLEKLLKEFLEAMHQLPVTGYTASELASFLQTRPDTDARLEDLLMHGQQAKFAAGSIQDQQMKQDLERAIGFVKKYTL